MSARKRQTKRRSIFVTSFSFFLVSFFGWLYETVLMIVCYGQLTDRGFLSLPFCPIYGAVVCGLYLLIGTPVDGWYCRWTGGLLRCGWPKWVERWVRYLGYFLLSALFATVAELVVGIAFQNAGVELWSYANWPMNYKGVICLPVSLFWGLVLTLAMRFPYQWILRLTERLPKWFLVFHTLVFAFALSVDFMLRF